ncbi:hypothetical protein [Streptomyces sp. NPDC093109]|uniref:hypothetical protein n=1 Tax=Streptomyces sp. NPDC093109 TaxID=3154977 RepID=UPI00344D3BD1
MAGTESAWAGDPTPGGAMGTRLNQLPADQGGTGLTGPFAPGGPRDLASSPAEKAAAAKAIEEHIQPDTRASGEWADEETAAVVKAFKAQDGHGWLAAAAVRKAHKTWESQVKALMDRLGSEKEALRMTGTLLQGVDIGTAVSLRSSALRNY